MKGDEVLIQKKRGLLKDRPIIALVLSDILFVVAFLAFASAIHDWFDGRLSDDGLYAAGAISLTAAFYVGHQGITGLIQRLKARQNGH